MSSIEQSIEVDVPISTVYNQWTQFESFPQFLSGVDSVTQITDARTQWVVSVGGAKREFTAEITEQHPDERIAWTSIEGPKHAGVVTFHRLSADRTRVNLQLDWEPEGFVEKAGAALQIDDLQVGSDLKKFKKLIEENGFEQGAWRGDIPRDADATGR